MVIVHNSKLASPLITDYYQPEKEMSVPVQVGVSYQSDSGPFISKREGKIREGD